MVLVGACSVYDTSLLEESSDAATTTTTTTATSSGTGGGGGQGGGSTTSSTTTGTGGGGGQPECNAPGDCPGQDSECAKRTCNQGTCGTMNTAEGTAVAAQTAFDCVEVQCDGMGNAIPAPDDLDIEDDNNDCTADTCSEGLPVHTPVAPSTMCGNGQFCNANAQCVECLIGSDCASGVCDNNNTCAAAGCGDGIKNGTETAIDCGGACPPCATGLACSVNADCVGGSCVGSVCAATCTDGLKNQNETDVDCGGPCSPCALGQTCSIGGDCQLGKCQTNTCVCTGNHLVLSEIRSRGAASAFDEIVELYNPTDLPITLDNTWVLESRSSSAGSYKVEWTGAGEVIPAHGHFLIVGGTYADAAVPDNAPTATDIGLTDAASVRISQNGSVIDAVCYYFSAATLNDFTTGLNFSCEGTPVSNSPHNNTTSVASNSDVSIERKPGGLALGNCIDTDDNAADWQTSTPANPQGTQSPLTPP